MEADQLRGLRDDKANLAGGGGIDRPTIAGEEIEYALEVGAAFAPSGRIAHGNDKANFTGPGVLGFCRARNARVGGVYLRGHDEQIEAISLGNTCLGLQVGKRGADAVVEHLFVRYEIEAWSLFIGPAAARLARSAAPNDLG